MPIKGLTDLKHVGFAEVGRIRKGGLAPNKNGKGEHPVDLPHFRLVFDETETEYAAQFYALYPKEPKRLNVFLPFNDVSQAWDAWLEAWAGGRLIARADGEKFVKWFDQDSGEYKVLDSLNAESGEIEPYDAEANEGHGPAVGKTKKGEPIYCKPVGRLRVMLRDIHRAAYLLLVTHSSRDIRALTGEINAAVELAQGVGTPLAGMPLILRKREEKVQYIDEAGELQSGSKYFLHLEPDAAFLQAAFPRLQAKAIPGALPANVEPLTRAELDAEVVDETEEEAIESTWGQQEEKPVRPERPYSPAVLKDGIARLAKKYQNAKVIKPATQPHRNVLAAQLDSILGGDEQKRHELCEWLVGEASTKSMKAAQVHALLEWLGVNDFDDIPNEDAVSEAHTALNAALVAAGQEAMEF